ncbi:hypothetical protein V5O48_017105, partial [Marasmius crinis-equi]
LITDRENKTHAFPTSISAQFTNNSELRDAYLEKEIVRLGTTYGLTSRHTSFVAVDRRSGQKLDTSQETDLVEEYGHVVRGTQVNRTSERLQSARAQALPHIQARKARLGAMPAAASPMMARAARAPSSAFGGVGSAQRNLKRKMMRSEEAQLASVSAAANFDPTIEDTSAGDSLNFSMGAAQPPPPPPAASSLRHTRAAPRTSLRSSAPSWSALGNAAAASTSAAPMSDGARLASIARLQGFDGGFSLTEELLRLLEAKSPVTDLKQKCAGENLDESVAATMLALLWLEKRGGDESLDLQEKASEWLEDALGNETQVALTKEKVIRLGLLGK